MDVGTRLIANGNGEIIAELGEYSSGLALDRCSTDGIFSIDLEYGSIDWETEKIVGVDLETMKPIIEKLPTHETDEQKRIRELEEDIELLKADSEIGGIL